MRIGHSLLALLINSSRSIEAFFPGDISSEWGGQFPTDFLGNTNARLVYECTTKEIAENIVNESIGSNDYAEEDTWIDMKNGTIKQDAIYHLNT